MAKAKQVATYLLSISKPSTPWSITPLKLQKLLYYCQGWYLAFNKEPLFEDDLVAWDHGPVVSEIYFDYKKNGYLTVPPEKFTNMKDNGKPVFSEKQLDILKAVWDSYGQYDGKYLEELTHQEDPWLNTPKNGVIKKSDMRKFFTALAKEA